jgi:hypothetical protein
MIGLFEGFLVGELCCWYCDSRHYCTFLFQPAAAARLGLTKAGEDGRRAIAATAAAAARHFQFFVGCLLDWVPTNATTATTASQPNKFRNVLKFG